MADAKLVWAPARYHILESANNCFTIISDKTSLTCKRCNVAHTKKGVETLADGHYLRAPVTLKSNALEPAKTACSVLDFAGAWGGTIALTTPAYIASSGLGAAQSIITEYGLAIDSEKLVRNTVLTSFTKEKLDEVCNTNLGNTTVPLTSFCPAPNDETLYLARMFSHLVNDKTFKSGCFAIGKIKGKNTIKIAFSGDQTKAQASITLSEPDVRQLSLYGGAKVEVLPAENELWSGYVGEFKTTKGKPAELTVKHCAESKLFADPEDEYESVVVIWLGSGLMSENYALNNQRSRGSVMLPCETCRGFLSHYLTVRST
ncbi:hypothetical protein KVQ82_12825 [Pseudomonas sp. AO-1]|uniref:hypothetical protein n=1 Tax=Pseudomonas sp. AO-1 TaxID=2855434 RepID=UPI001C75C00F|nr:hypothetical protein [Pseudomonas sp. AO-1]QXZ16745.1 hypothetical protein KVQ82_12825 [Pseudomonas sp. AO-1]